MTWVGHHPAGLVGSVLMVQFGLSVYEVMGGLLLFPLRLVLGKKPVQEPVFSRLFTARNVAQAGTPPTPTGGYGKKSDYVNGYRKRWGVG